MISRLLLFSINSISLTNYNTISNYCNKPVRIRLSQLINAIIIGQAVQEVNKLGTVNIF